MRACVRACVLLAADVAVPPSHKRLARSMVGNVQRCNAHIAPGSYEVVSAFSVFEHLVAPWRAAAEMVRCAGQGSDGPPRSLPSCRPPPCHRPRRGDLGSSARRAPTRAPITSCAGGQPQKPGEHAWTLLGLVLGALPHHGASSTVCAQARRQRRLPPRARALHVAVPRVPRHVHNGPTQTLLPSASLRPICPPVRSFPAWLAVRGRNSRAGPSSHPCPCA